MFTLKDHLDRELFDKIFEPYLCYWDMFDREDDYEEFEEEFEINFIDEEVLIKLSYHRLGIIFEKSCKDIPFERDVDKKVKLDKIYDLVCKISKCISCNHFYIPTRIPNFEKPSRSDVCNPCLNVMVFYKNIIDDNCSICREPLKCKVLTKLKCSHMFHYSCIYKKNINSKCPLYRTGIESKFTFYNPIHD